ncbi:MAG: nucleotidyltransferase [Bacillota bacterium]
MQTTGLIVEYNPFHNGHNYHLKQSKIITDSQPAIAVMSGNFTQRGEPALLDKWIRSKMAIQAGVDLVLELPVSYAIRSAEYFARGAVLTLAYTGLVNKIVFGSEQGNLKILEEISSLLVSESSEFKKLIKSNLNNGLSFPQARAEVIREILGEDAYRIISKPNNILAIEYLKAIKKYNLPIQAKTIERKDSNYHDKSPGQTDITSATAIRKLVYNNKIKTATKYIPECNREIFINSILTGKGPASLETWKSYSLFNIRRLDQNELLDIPAISHNLANSILDLRNKVNTYSELIESLTSKTYPKSRIRRAVIQASLRLSKSKYRKLKLETPAYLRVLAIGSKGKNILSELADKARVPIIIQPANYLNIPDFNTSNKLKYQLSLDLNASNLYSLLIPDKTARTGNRDFTERLIDLKDLQS